MDLQSILLERKDHTTWITLNRPEHNNQLNSQLLEELSNAMKQISADPAARVLVLYGGASKAFCGGADVAGLREEKDMPILHRREMPKRYVEILREFRDLDKPTIAAVNGHAMGGGSGLAMACDFVIMAEQAKIGFPEILVGFIPAIVLVNLIRLLPWRTVVELVYTGKMLTAKEAKDIGLINNVVPKEHLIQNVEELANSLASRSPAAIKLTKQVMRAVEHMGFDGALAYASDMNVISQLTEDFSEGVKAYTEKREPRWTGI